MIAIAEAVQRQKETLQLVFGNIPVMLLVSDNSGQVTLINRGPRPRSAGW